MLEFDHVSVQKGRNTILQDVTFTPREGKITALLGKNGSGKSTLLSCVTRLTPYAGRIMIDGVEAADLAPKERAKKLALFPQILPETPFTVRRLAELGRNPYVGPDGRLSAVDREAVSRAITLVGMDDLAHRPVNTLSGGERQRAFLAMLLAQDTPTLLLDEPATFLDADAARELYSLISDLSRGHGKTVVAVMHDLSAAVSLADDIVILDRGRLAFCGTARDCLTENAIERVFSVTPHVTRDGTVFFR